TIDPTILGMVAAVNADTLHKNLRQLQDWGSRFMLNDNHKNIATWLMNKFLSYGYTDVKLDSFYNIVNSYPFYDSTWQYNVKCTLRGSSAPDEIYVIGGHYDSYSDPDPYLDAPGVDDNGSSVAATLEIARVMALMNYLPEATIQFTLFAAEELGVFGSQYAAVKARQAGSDIRFMFSLDQIAYDPQNLNEVGAAWYPDYEWACYAAAEALERYTDLSVIIFDIPFNGGSDSYSYWSEGFPPVACIEKDFSPYGHTPADTLGNCNIPYLSKIAGGALATLAEQQLSPIPQNVIAHSTKADIILQWKPTNNERVLGVNLYRSDTTGGPYQKISPSVVSDTVYHDLAVEPNKQFYYVLTTVNDSLLESGFSKEVSGAKFNFCDTLLILANLKGAQTTPDSVIAFYHAALDTMPFVWHDLNASKHINIAMLSRYHSIFWMSNTANFEVIDDKELQDVSEFINNGGNLLFTGFIPMKFWMNANTCPIKVPQTALFRQIFKVDSVNRRAQCLLFRAYTAASGYDNLNVDSLKYMLQGYPGQIYNVDVFAPTSEGRVIYRFDTKFDSTTNLGRLKHKPVGIEYMGSDFKSILLSFPLYYMDTSDVRDFLRYVMTQKFNLQVGAGRAQSADHFTVNIYPNPVKDDLTLTVTLSEPYRVKITLSSIRGQLLNTLTDQNFDQGTHQLQFDMSSFPFGLYQIVVQNNKGRIFRKIVRIR
ncbi:MAG: M20/M25/M40 family metallo-hydrolase, partial [Bacteroidota bacterium]